MTGKIGHIIFTYIQTNKIGHIVLVDLVVSVVVYIVSLIYYCIYM